MRPADARRSDRHPVNVLMPQKKNGPSRGHSCVDLLIFVVMMLDDHHLITVAMAPAFVPAAVAMFAELSPRTGAIMIAVAIVVAVADHDVLGACDRRRGDRDGAECGNHISKLLHAVLLHQQRIKHSSRVERSDGTSREF